MIDVETIAVKTKVDLGGWNSGLREADDSLDEFTRRAADRLDRMPAPKFTAPEVSLGGGGSAEDGGPAALGEEFEALGAQIEKVGVTFGSLGREMGQDIAAAAAPIQQFARRFEANFDEMGATVEELAIRVDSAMRFPDFERRTEAVIGWIGKRLGRAGKEAKGQFEAGAAGLDVAATYGFAAAPAAVDGWLDRVKASVARGGRAIGARLGAGVAYGLEAATHHAPNMATAFINARSRGSNGRINGMQSPPPQAGPSTRPAVGATAWTKAWDAARKAVGAAVWADVASWKAVSATIGKMRDADAKDLKNIIGAWLNWKRAGEVISNFGSVANATFAKLHGVKLPKLSIDPRQSEVVAGLGKAATAASGSFLDLGKTIAGALGLFGATYKAVDWLKDGIAGASNLNETLSKTDAVLGKAAPGVKRYAEEMADQFGIVKQQALDAASGFGGILKGMGGMTGKELETASKDLTQLAADLASFGNVSFDQAAEALRSGLVGNESDFLKKIGVDLKDAAVESYSFASGLNKSTEDMSEAEKVGARLRLMFQDTKDAQGDLAKTADSTSNMWKNLTGTMTNFGVEVGEMMLPAVDQGLRLLLGGVDILKAGFEASRDTIGGWITAVASGFDFVAAAINHPSAVLEVLRLTAVQTLMNIGEYLAVLGPNFVTVAEYIGRNWKELFADAFNAIKAGIKNLFVNLQNFGAAIGTFLADPTRGFEFNWTPLLEGFQRTSEKFPELLKPVLTDMGKEIAQAGKPIMDDFAARRAEAMKEKEGFSEAKGDALSGGKEGAPEKAKKGKKEEQFTGALELGSKEAYSAFAAAAYGGRGKTSEADKNTREQVKQQKDGNAVLRQIAKAVAGAPVQVSLP